MVLRIVLADDAAGTGSGLRDLVGRAPDLEIVAAAASGLEAVRLTRELGPDVVLMNVRVAGINGMEASRMITRTPGLAGVRVVMLAEHITEEWVLGSLNSGASGFFETGSSTEDLAEVIRTVARGGAHLSSAATRCVLDTVFPLIGIGGLEESRDRFGQLTSREREVVALAALGLENKEISARLVVSPLTVKTHVTRAMAKLDVRSRSQMVALVHRNGLVPRRHGSAQDPAPRPGGPHDGGGR
ncbi:LuxR C-terminal-related transcriptional regulator [Streptomyces sp. NPDC056796]|uniref:LuxR C-terminal-related transcriptional regulator n=1 Tax=unclassified Streptomyces TaxID=2593676 RepID=UPI0036A9227B